MTASLLVRRPGAAVALPPVEAPASAARRGAGLARRVAARTLPWLVRGLVGSAIVAFAALAVGPHVLGYRTMTMLTASMSPVIDPGDITIVTPVAVDDVTEGMVIAYNIPIDDHQVVTHRVISVERDAAGVVTVQTKGDANEAVDPWRAALQGDTAWQVRAVVPEVGHAIQALRGPLVAELLRYGAPALLAGWLLLAIWRPARGESAADAAEAAGTATDEEVRP
ncbi:signal peptidase I [Geodermatophilus sp. YIM 151500]|uniref:signal peptidase I n=1 Tax=Geodermatophilus sp. YIM 151500 TaxID=2984531 RepID=UPI0021E43E99|nr:signal peptidase I [Geodermatophilus sp. YIM 151500]MCV2491603.1 signal peptidase I [Geodermatophilus sp. YIM 151500]